MLAAESPLRATLERILPTRVPLLLTGPPGRGKQWAARAAHAMAGVAGPLIEAERASGPGGPATLGEVFEAAGGGTLLVAGLEGAPDQVQRELAELLDRRSEAVVIVLAENDPDRAVAEGHLRRDVGDRLVWAEVDPLRRRRCDVEPGLRMFLRREAGRAGRPAPALHEVVRARLRGYPWPGDVAELERFAERAMVLDSVDRAFTMVARHGELGADTNELWDSVCRRLREGQPVSLERVRRRMVREAERAWVDRVLHSVRGDTRRAAEVLGVSPNRMEMPGSGGGR